MGSKQRVSFFLSFPLYFYNFFYTMCLRHSFLIFYYYYNPNSFLILKTQFILNSASIEVVTGVNCVVSAIT